MPSIESLDPDTSIRDWIADDLRFYRERDNLSQSEIGRIIGASRHTVSNIEHARSGWNLNEDQARRLDSHFDLNHHFMRLVRYARNAHTADWSKQHVTYEQRASLIKTYEALVVPGLLQTPDYARALLEAGRVRDPEASAERRVSRQAVLAKTAPPDLWVIMSENTLDWPVGGPSVMREQLAKLLDMAERPNISVRLLPRSVGAHEALEGSFKVMTVHEGDVVYMEACGGGRTAVDVTDVASLRVRFDRIGQDALPRNRSRDLIRQAMERYQ
ncbi:helix-turn-helix transcriptional regulator [Actinomadura vinacea]|uniref:Helix-turn-helix transcriptional regulator n=1 Tax=Actinomadura vinacea TaxID=115336 RepID=A0ABN3J8W9_9ACTN